MTQSRQLAAIMFTDIVGYKAKMQQNEEKAVAIIKHNNTTLENRVTHFNGQVFFTIFDPLTTFRYFANLY